MGSNVSLAREMEQSSYLLNFVRQNGPPHAIEVVGDSADSAELRMYYVQGRHYFGATRVTVNSLNEEAGARETAENRGGSTHQWIIRGPYPVQRENYRQLSALPSISHATFEMFGARQLFGTEAVAENFHEIKPVSIPASTPTPRPKPHRNRRAPANTAGDTSHQASSNQATNFDQRALLEAKSLAPRSPNGDLVHTVKSATETVTSITNWYTGSGGNATQVAEKNSVPLDAKLTPGRTITIPGGIVTNPRVLP